MSEIKYTELDFNLIKDNLKNFLKSQEKFKDYNFDGSSMSILLDVLAYNTGYNAFYLNMLASEMFLDSASLRESIVSRAKHLGYTPRSVRTSKAVIDYEVYFDSENAVLPANLILPKTQEFFTTVDGVRYTFYPAKSTFFTKIGTRRYKITDLELVEGKRLTHSYTVTTTSAVKQRYIIPNESADTSTLLVTVKESASDTTKYIYNPNNDITEVASTDLVYFLQAYRDNLYEVIFGDNVIGKGVTDGNIVQLDYVVSTGDGATGATGFRTGKLSGISVVGNQGFTVTTKIAANGYSEQESSDSVKLLAPKAYEAQNRAVTKYDYETLIKKDVPSVEHVRVWGGEENVPPEYGKVFCSIKPKTGDTLNLEDKNRIINTYIRNRNLLTLDVSIIDPEYIRVILDCSVNFNSNKTTLDADAVKYLVEQAIQNYKLENVYGFDADFRHSKLVKYIDDSDDSIVSNDTDVKIKYRIIPTLNAKNKFTINLNNSIDTGDYNNNVSSVTSSVFLYRNSRVFLADDGKGTMFLYYYSSDGNKVIVEDSVGTVNYETGQIVVSNLLVSSIPDGINYIDFTIVPNSFDVIALREQMILIESEDTTVTMVDVARLRLS